MNIKQTIYNNLTSNQRVTAAIEAIKRDDKTEALKLLSNVEIDNRDVNIKKVVVHGFIDLETGETFTTSEIMNIGERKSWICKHREKLETLKNKY